MGTFFWTTMTSLTESFNLSKHTPLFKKEQNESEIIQMETIQQQTIKIVWPKVGVDKVAPTQNKS